MQDINNPIICKGDIIMDAYAKRMREARREQAQEGPHEFYYYQGITPIGICDGCGKLANDPIHRTAIDQIAEDLLKAGFTQTLALEE